MKTENIIIIALVAFVLFFFMKKPSKAIDVTQNNQLPAPSQNAQLDGGAARALISEGIDAGAGVINNLINHAFSRSEENVPPQTASNTI